MNWSYTDLNDFIYCACISRNEYTSRHKGVYWHLTHSYYMARAKGKAKCVEFYARENQKRTYEAHTEYQACPPDLELSTNHT